MAKYEQVKLRIQSLESEEITRDIPNLSEEAALKEPDENGIIRIGAEATSRLTNFRKLSTPKSETDLTAEVRMLVQSARSPEVRDTLKVPHGETVLST